MLLYLFSGDSKGEDRCDVVATQLLSQGMCFVHGIKDRILYLYGWDTLLYKSVILSQTLFFIQELLKAITRSQEKED